MNQPPLLTGKPAGSNLLARIVVAVTALGLLALGIAFSIVFLAIAFVVVGVFVARVWWKTRHMRKQMREAAGQMRHDAPEASQRGRIIEGEVVRADESGTQDGDPRR